MNKIYALCGLSGSGKTTLANEISRLLDIPFIISYTTRPIRPGEKNHVDYHFIDDRKWDILTSIGALVATQSFNVDGGHVWKYGILQDDLMESCIMVLTPSGIEDLRSAGYDIVSIYIDIDEELRLNRIRTRNDNQSKNEIRRRSKDDKKAFKSFSAEYTIKNNGDLYDTLLDLIELIM